MKIEAADFLRLVERAGTLVTFDFETTGFQGDYDTGLVFSWKHFDAKPESASVSRVGRDKAIMRQAKAVLESADAWLSYYGKGFDIKFLNTRLLRHGLPPVEKRPHIDLYWIFKSHVATKRKSLAHMLDWLKLDERKLSVSADDWASAPAQWKEIRPLMIKRCESDCTTLQSLYERVKHLITDIRR